MLAPAMVAGFICIFNIGSNALLVHYYGFVVRHLAMRDRGTERTAETGQTCSDSDVLPSALRLLSLCSVWNADVLLYWQVESIEQL